MGKKKTFSILLGFILVIVTYEVSCAFDLKGITGSGARETEEVKFDLRELLAPLNEQFKKVMEQINKKFPDRKGMIGALLFQYARDSIILSRDEETDYKKAPFTMVAVVPQTMIKDKDIPQHTNVKPDEFLEIITVNRKESNPLKMTYLLGENKFDLIYMSKLGLAIKQTKDKVKQGGPAALGLSKDLEAATTFTKNLLGLFAEMSKGGSVLMKQIIKNVTDSLTKPDDRALQ